VIQYKLLNKASLLDFVNSPEFEHMPFIPITRHRALSHINNPRADADDVLLVLAYSGNELAGYLGIIPDIIFTSSGQSHRCGVFSCIWVNPNSRGEGIALSLIEKAHEQYDKIIVAGPVPSTIPMYYRSNLFGEPLIRNGIRLYVRMDMHSILPPKRKLFQLIKPILHFGDAAMNLMLDTRFLFSKNIRSEVNVEYVTAVDDEAAKFIGAHEDKQLCRRGQTELNWIMKFPWVLVKQKPDRDSLRYFFTSSDTFFEVTCLKLRDNENKLTAFLMFTRRNKVLTLPYVYMVPGSSSSVAVVIIHHIYKWRINTFTTFHPDLCEYFASHKTGVIYKKILRRSYLISKELDLLLRKGDFKLQDGDADLAFT
jgi:hypothetical protein